ncbi:hypothetical protein ATI61_117112 [Archangium gephyra]|uniref:Uncharacterized protein n=1 Tax=Archangium gephyra TaxID=48 RepID=A0AAC8Q804_9BACT|nr:hypothetical protein [Archangium gephyra]AKJ02722.1 Hypothetical protein AA314_04348 [Archangium gephyra]REG23267.1 hypothetical protein ATI61_117112 [Archangium gephyra]
MRPEDLLTTAPTAERLAKEAERLPEPAPEQVESLRRLLDASQRAPAETEWPPILQAPRSKKDSRYVEPPTSHRPVVGPVLVTAKRAFRLAFQPFINEVLRKQVEFNEAILDSLALIYEHQREESRTQTAWRREVMARLSALERPTPKQTSPEQTPPERTPKGRSRKS